MAGSAHVRLMVSVSAGRFHLPTMVIRVLSFGVPALVSHSTRWIALSNPQVLAGGRLRQRFGLEAYPPSSGKGSVIRGYGFKAVYPSSLLSTNVLSQKVSK